MVIVRDDEGCHLTSSLLGRACETEEARTCYFLDNCTALSEGPRAIGGDVGEVDDDDTGDYTPPSPSYS